LYVAPLAVYAILATVFADIVADPRYFSALVLAVSAYLLLTTVLFFVRFMAYYLDMWIVTNDRIVDIEQYNLFARTITELDLFHITDATSEVHGFFPTVFNYGNVQIKTASPNMDIIFHNVPHPNKIREELIHLSHEDRKFHFMQPATNVPLTPAP
jgi:hypothetical protein